MRLLLGGSPCTHWSIAQTKNRETEPSGLGWELFKNYLIAREKYKPDYFLYENNKSMAAAIREQITKELGVQPVLINSALVSAQNRNRLYWAGKRMPDGSYATLEIQQPEDRGILLRDILESGIAVREKGYCLSTTAGNTTPEDAFKRNHRNVAAEPAIKQLTEREMDYMVRETKDGRNHFDFDYHHDSTEDKSACVTANTHRGVPYNVCAECINPAPDGKSRTVDAHMKNLENCLIPRVNNPNQAKQQYDCIVEPINTTVDGKAQCLRATYYKDGIRNMVGNNVDRKTCAAEPIRVCNINGGGQGDRIYSVDGKSCAIKAQSGGAGGHGQGLYAMPITEYILETEDGKTYQLYKDGIRNMVGNDIDRKTCVAEPIRIGTIDSDTKHPEHDSQQYRVYSEDGKSVTLCGGGGGLVPKQDCMQSGSAPAMRVREATKRGYVDILPGECVDLSMPNSKTRRGRSMKNKSNCLTTSCEYYEYCGTLDKPVYQVKDGYITIKDKQYPIKLRDGCYIIRKLTVTECKRLQTVPDSYVFPVSDSQAYKMLGNGWTVEVIAHILSHIPEITEEPVEVLSMYDGMSCGHLALDRLGAEVVAYYATEIDKYAIQTTQHNYPDTVQLGDAFQVREDGWRLPQRSEKE